MQMEVTILPQTQGIKKYIAKRVSVHNTELRQVGINSVGNSRFVFVARVSPYGICGRQSSTGTGFLRVFRFPLLIIPSIAPY
jgi:hypothetical protein